MRFPSSANHNRKSTDLGKSENCRVEPYPEIKPGGSVKNEDQKDTDLVRAEDDRSSKTKKNSGDTEESKRQASIDELRDLQIQEAKERMDAAKARREDRKRKAAAYQEALAAEQTSREQTAEECTHKKGGKVGVSGGMEALYKGNDQNYSVVKHTLPLGETVVICQRCPKVWRKPSDELKKADPKAYKEALQEYQWATRLPTDNEPSGSQNFLAQRGTAA
jgi:hypothetical protein